MRDDKRFVRHVRSRQCGAIEEFFRGRPGMSEWGFKWEEMPNMVDPARERKPAPAMHFTT
jgi:hypothetical protein